jgi:hypothetical protein
VTLLMKIKKIHILLAMLALALCTIPFRQKIRRSVVTAIQVRKGLKTVAKRVEEFGPAVRQRLAGDFQRLGVTYPPKKITLVGLKQEKLLELWVSDPPRLLKTYRILGASGVPGPKLIQGDRQVPEGIYQIDSLNPNSLFHLALHVNYPNAHDRAKGRLDGREDLGGDIMIHGGSGSIGCLAMGDEAAEDLFVVVAETGIDNVSVILSPMDFRKRELPADMPDVPAWTPELYRTIQQELRRLDPALR